MNYLPNNLRKLIPNLAYTDSQIETMYWLLFDDSVEDSERASILDLINEYRPELAQNIAKYILESIPL